MFMDELGHNGNSEDKTGEIQDAKGPQGLQKDMSPGCSLLPPPKLQTPRKGTCGLERPSEVTIVSDQRK